MASEWKQARLGDICEVVRGGSPRPIIDYITDDEDGVNWLKIGDVKETDKYFTHANERIKRSGIPKTREVKKGDLILSNSMSFGRAFITLIDGYIHDGWLRLRCDEHVVSKEYLYYFLISSIAQNQFKAVATGSVVNNLKSDTVKDTTIVLPPMSVQKQMVAALDALDQKIVVNQKINDNLQQQAQAVFSVWLASHASAADEVTLGGICLKVTDGSHFSPKDDPSAKIPMLSVKDMEEFDFNLSSCKHISAEDFQKMVANDCVPQVDDILVAKDGSYLKEIFICNEQREMAILSSIAIFRPDTSIIYPEILLAFLKSPRVLQEVRDNYVSGSALPRIVLKDFKKLQFSLPNLTAQEEIAPLLATIRLQIAVNVAENHRLTQLRDVLLPQLMSGEVNVSSIQL